MFVMHNNKKNTTCKFLHIFIIYLRRSINTICNILHPKCKFLSIFNLLIKLLLMI